MKVLLNTSLTQLALPELDIERTLLSPAVDFIASNSILVPLSESFERHPGLIGTGLAIAGLQAVTYLERRFAGTFSEMKTADRMMRDLFFVTSMMATATGINVAADPMEFPAVLTAGFYGLSLGIFMMAYRINKGENF